MSRTNAQLMELHDDKKNLTRKNHELLPASTHSPINSNAGLKQLLDLIADVLFAEDVIREAKDE